MTYITILIFFALISTQIFAQPTLTMMTASSIQSTVNQQQLQFQILSFPRQPLYSTSIYFNPNHHALRPRSWQRLRDHHVIRQHHDFSCGAAAMAALLNDYYQQNFTEQQLLTSMNQKDGIASFADMQKVLTKLGFQVEGYAISLHTLQQLKIPVIAYIKHRKNNHFTVISGINQNFVRLADPSLGQRILSMHQFKPMWQTHTIDNSKGKILLIVPKEAVIEVPKNLACFSKDIQ